jgi:hypothetical protein
MNLKVNESNAIQNVLMPRKKKTLKVRPMETIVMVKLMEDGVLPGPKSANITFTFVEYIVVRF